jgi:DNA-binding SARP family transcriptional activator/tetratricopeptide (TPR) repeat protein
VRFRLLGALECEVDGRPVRFGWRQERLVLALLLMEPGRLVTLDRLGEMLWAGNPPADARGTIQAVVSRLRKSLHSAGADEHGVRLVTSGTSYALDIPADRIDLHQFRVLVGQARSTADPAERAATLRAALALWRGPALADLAGEGLWPRICAPLEQQKLSAWEDLIDAELAAGNHQLVGELTQLAVEHPQHERFRARLMLVLYRAGRRAEALNVFHDLARSLRDDFGIEPGAELQTLYQRILTADPSLDPPAGGRPRPTGPPPTRPQPAGAQPAAVEAADTLTLDALSPPLAERLGEDPATIHPDAADEIITDPARTGSRAQTVPARPVPRQLPAPPQGFTGRAMELADLEKNRHGSTVVITAIDGMAGVGKTAVAVQAAHQMIDGYPDGQLFIDLHGYTDGVAPIQPGEALDGLLRSLGVPAERIPADLDQRAALYRSRLADQRVLIVLDNAAAEAHVAPLLPGAPSCLVLVTSRRRLAGLDHTHTLSLDTLPPEDAARLLRQTAGDSRLAAQPPELLDELVELCGRLPLAIRIAAARLRSHPAWDLAHLVRRLRDQQHRLVELEAGQRSVTAALDLSYQQLSPQQQYAYRVLGLHPGPDIDEDAAAALLDATSAETGQLLEQLLEAHLLQEPVPGRYRFHDLTRAHAAHTATREETEESRRSALDRLLDYYQQTAAEAMDSAYPYERERRPQASPPHTPAEALPDPAPALNWLDNELHNLLAAARYATEHDRPAHLLHLSATLHRHLRNRGPYHHALALHQQALTTARATGHQTAELEALVGLGNIHRQQGRYEQATDHYQQALQLARTAGHRPGELDALIGLGNIHLMQGRLGQATDHYEQALQLAGPTGHDSSRLQGLVGLGHIHRVQGRLGRATDHYQQALQGARATGHRPAELNALVGLGMVHRWQGRYEQAADHYQQALQLARSTGHRTAEQAALAGLGHVHRCQGRYEQATGDYQRLLDLAHECSNRNNEFEAWQGLGRVQQTTGDPAAALTRHEQALALATELGQPDDQARAHDGLAHAHHALHEDERARTHWQHALDILTRLAVDNTDDEETGVAAIRGHLAELGDPRKSSPGNESAP